MVNDETVLTKAIFGSVLNFGLLVAMFFGLWIYNATPIGYGKFVRWWLLLGIILGINAYVSFRFENRFYGFQITLSHTFIFFLLVGFLAAILSISEKFALLFGVSPNFADRYFLGPFFAMISIFSLSIPVLLGISIIGAIIYLILPGNSR